MNADITLTIGFTTTNLIPAAGFVFIEVLASYQLVFKVKDGAALSCSNSLNSGQAVQCFAFKSYIKVMDLCGTNVECPVNSKFNLIVTSGMRNPRFVLVTTMKIYTALQIKDKQGFIDGLETGIIAEP